MGTVKNEKWVLKKAKPSECIMDNSGIYAVINRQEKTETHKEYAGKLISVRIDVMSDDNVPLISFEGNAEDVRKDAIRWIDDNIFTLVTLEHASYIGAELERAMLDPGYIQR